MKTLLFALLIGVFPFFAMGQAPAKEKITKGVVVIKSDSTEFVSDAGNYIFDPILISNVSVITQADMDARFGKGKYNLGMMMKITKPIKFINLQQLLDIYKIDPKDRHLDILLDNRPVSKDAVFIIDQTYVKDVYVKRGKLYIFRRSSR